MAELKRCIRCKQKREKCSRIVDAIGVYCPECRAEIKHYRQTRPFKRIPLEPEG